MNLSEKKIIFEQCFCKGNEYRILRNFGEYKVLECINCGLYRSFPLPTESVCENDYQILNDVQKLHYHQVCVLKKVMNLSKNKDVNILDIGCSTGNMLLYLKNKGYNNLSGIEMNDYAVEICRKKNLNVKKMDSVKLISNEKYDVIYLNHVLEHIEDLKGFITNVSEILLNGAHLIIAVPNIGGRNTNYNDWIGYQFKQHYWHFTPDSLEKIFANKNFNPEENILLEGGMIKSRLYKLFGWEGDSLISVFINGN